MDYEIKETPSEKVKKMYQEYLSFDLNDKIEFIKLVEGKGNSEKFSHRNLEEAATCEDLD